MTYTLFLYWPKEKSRKLWKARPTIIYPDNSVFCFFKEKQSKKQKQNKNTDTKLKLSFVPVWLYSEVQIGFVCTGITCLLLFQCRVYWRSSATRSNTSACHHLISAGCGLAAAIGSVCCLDVELFKNSVTLQYWHAGYSWWTKSRNIQQHSRQVTFILQNYYLNDFYMYFAGGKHHILSYYQCIHLYWF